MTNPDPEQIAALLTDAQREDLSAFSPHYSRYVPEPEARGLLELNLLNGPGRLTHPSQRDLSPQYILTPLGRAVRNHLKGSDNGAV